MDAEREAREVLSSVTKDWSFEIHIGCPDLMAEIESAIAAALRRAHAAGRREAVEECARVVRSIPAQGSMVRGEALEQALGRIRAEAAERDLKLAQVGLFHDSDGAQYSLLETKKILREREAAEAAVKRLTEASWLYIAEWAKAVGAAQAAEERATVAEAAIVTARAALTPAGGGDGR